MIYAVYAPFLKYLKKVLKKYNIMYKDIQKSRISSVPNGRYLS